MLRDVSNTLRMPRVHSVLLGTSISHDKLIHHHVRSKSDAPALEPAFAAAGPPHAPLSPISAIPRPQKPTTSPGPPHAASPKRRHAEMEQNEKKNFSGLGSSRSTPSLVRRGPSA